MSKKAWLKPEDYLVALEYPEKLNWLKKNRGGYWWPELPTEILHPTNTESSNEPLRKSKRKTKQKGNDKLTDTTKDRNILLYGLGIKQDIFSESVREWYERVKEEVKKYKLDKEEEEEDVIRMTFTWGLKPSIIREAVYRPGVYFSSIENILKVAEEMEEIYNKKITDIPMDNKDMKKKKKKKNDNDEWEPDFEDAYRPVHAYDCTCEWCSIIRLSLEKKTITAPGEKGEKKIVYIRRVPSIIGDDLKD